MHNTQPTFPQWICEHCFIHLVNGDCTQPDNCHPVRCWALHPGVDHPLYLFRSMVHVTPGMLDSEHSCGRENGEETDECDCERNTYSTSPCDGCNSVLHGAREAVTGWLPA